VYNTNELWDLAVEYATQSLWAEEGSFKGFSVGLIAGDEPFHQRRTWKYESGWCGQNISLSVSLMEDYLRHNHKEALDKAVACLDCWADNCLLPNGLFVVNYDMILDEQSAAAIRYPGMTEINYNIDACNLGGTARNFFEAYNVAKKCGIDRPRYQEVAFKICDFVLGDQQTDGCYGMRWKTNGEILVRERLGGLLHRARHGRGLPAEQGWPNTWSRPSDAFDFYYTGLEKNGYSTAGALDTWCIDKESSIPLLQSAMRLYEETQDKQYLDDAVHISYYLSTYLWHNNGVYGPEDDFTRYAYNPFGATSVSVQHHHLDVFSLLWINEWLELSELTGDPQWKQKAVATWKNGCQLISDGTLEVNGLLRPRGSQNEAYYEADWNFANAADGQQGQRHRINQWLVAWPSAFRLETLRHLPADKWPVLDDK